MYAFFSNLISWSPTGREPDDTRFRYGYICLLISFLVSTSVVVASTQDRKWLAAVCLGIAVSFSSLLLQKILRPLLLAGAVFLIPIRINFYPIYKPTAFIPTGTEGLPITILDIVLVFLVSFWLLEVIKNKEKINLFPSISIPFLLYIIFTGISAFWSAEYVLSFCLLAMVIKSYIFLIVFANQVKDENDVKLIILGLCGGVLLQTFIGLLQFTGVESFSGLFGESGRGLMFKVQGNTILSRVTGTFGHANGLAKFVSFCIPIIFVFAYYHRRSIVGLLALLCSVAGGVTLLFTLTRGSWIGAGIAMAFVLFELAKRHYKNRLKSIIMVTIILSLAIGVIIGLFEDVRVRLFENDYNSAESRIPMAMVALNIIKANPVKGIGLNNYTRVMNRYDNTRNRQTYIFPFPVHNGYLLIAAESGIQTLLVFLWIIGAAIRKGRAAFDFSSSFTSLLEVGWIASMSTWLIADFFDCNYAGSNVMLWFVVAMIAATSQLPRPENQGKIKDDTLAGPRLTQ